MSTDADDANEGDGRMEKIDVRVPVALLDEIDAKYEKRGYTSRSEAIRDALRDWANPPVTLSEEILEDLMVSRQQREQGETRSLGEVAGKYGVRVDRDET